jgi:hydrophobic/amphiphilic exporter-1 (mainly G- bacteria), HAE1 family
MNIVDLSIKRPIMISMGLIALVLFGLMSYFSLPQSLFPNISVPYVTVQTTYAGASPEVIETQITKKIEDQVSAISELDTIQSYSMDSASIVMIEFKLGKDENLALQEVKDKVDAISTDLPDDADKPVISKININSLTPVANLSVEGDLSPTELYTFASNTVSNRLSQIAGVGSVDISGGSEREIQVNINRSTVYERSVPVTQISGILAAANVDLPGGNFTYRNRDIPVQMKGKFTGLDQIRDLDVPTKTGIFKLRQLADVDDTSKTARVRTILLDKKAETRNGNTILLQIIKNPSANTVQVVDGVLKQIPVIEQMSGGHVRLNVIQEDATYVRDTVNDTLSNIYLGILFTGLVLLLFLHDLRSTLIIALAMPFSIVATFLVMKAMGIGLNMISLMGLSSSTGTLVANSVVVLENIFRYKELGHDRVESASQGTKEVIVAVFASTLTNIAVFIPLGSMSNLIGEYLLSFAYTIVIATVFSIVVSFTLTPLMASRILPEKVKKEGKLSTTIEKILSGMEKEYRRILNGMLRRKRRSAIVIAATMLVFIASMAMFSRIPFELFSTTDGGKIQLTAELPQGSDLDATAALLKTIEDRIAAYKEVTKIETILGTFSSVDQDVSEAQMNIFLVSKKDRQESNSFLAVRMTKDLASVPGAKIQLTPLSELSVGDTDHAVDLYLKGEDTGVLQRYADEIQKKMNTMPGIMNTSLSSKSGKQELDFTPDRKQLSEDGLTVQDIAVTLRAAVDGQVTTKYKEGGNEYDIRVKISGGSLKDIEDIRNIPVVSQAGVYPVSRYADVKFADATNKIMRVDKIRTVEITADTLPGYAQGTAINSILDTVKTMNLPAGYTIKAAGNAEMLGETVRDLLTVFVIAVILVYMLLAATLESLTQPLFILSTVPLCLIGVVAICLITGTTMDMMSMLGVIMLVGIVVNNAILILDYYNQLKAGGMNVKEALLKACPTKLKAILMSNIAIVLGMLPMAMGVGASGAEMRQPMGIVIIGGIISATFLTLFLVPALEYLVSHNKEPVAVSSGK